MLILTQKIINLFDVLLLYFMKGGIQTLKIPLLLLHALF